MSEDDEILCACCNQPTLSEIGGYEICPVCGWEDDPVQRDDESFPGGANKLSLSKARLIWNETKKRLDEFL
jgi:Cysteine-rich CPCC